MNELSKVGKYLEDNKELVREVMDTIPAETFTDADFVKASKYKYPNAYKEFMIWTIENQLHKQD